MTDEEGIGDLMQEFSAINNKIPYKSELSKEEQSKFIVEMIEAPKPGQLLQQYFESGAKILLSQSAGPAGDGFDRLAKEICALHESGLLTHFAINYPTEDELLFHRFLDGDLSPDMEPFIDDIQPDILYTKILDPMEALLLYRETLRKIRDAGVQFLLYKQNRNIDSNGENAFDHQLRTLLAPIRQGGRLFVQSDDIGGFCATKNHLTDRDGEMHISLVPALKRELSTNSVISIYNTSEEGLSMGTMMFKVNNFEEVFNLFSSSRDMGLDLTSSVIRPIHFRIDRNETMGDAWDAIIIRTEEDNEDPEEQEKPIVEDPKELKVLQSA